MTLQKKMSSSSASPAVDEIDEIMNEIEELQQSMSATQAAPAAAAPAKAKAVAAAPAPTPVEEEPNVMDEFKGSSGDVSMEETLADLKDEEPSGPNLIDQAMEAEAARENAAKGAEEAEPEATHEAQADAESQGDSEHDELLDEAEAEALNDAIAEEEEAAVEEEEVQMSESPRRSRPDHRSRTTGGSVSLKLTGDMVLRLSYEFEGQEVSIGFSDGALRVELSDGTEFRIPVRRNSLRKAA